MSQKRMAYDLLCRLYRLGDEDTAAYLLDVALAAEAETLRRRLYGPPRMLVALDRITHTEVKELTLTGLCFEEEAARERFWDFWGMMPSAPRLIE